jgi:hypothetical protein
MVAISIDARQLDNLSAALAHIKGGADTAIMRAINDSSRHTNTQLIKKIREKVAFKKVSDVKKFTKVKLAKKTALKGAVILNESARISLRYFGARQTKKGVSYRIAKDGKRPMIRGAFQGPKPGVMKASWKGNVFRRVGKARLPIIKLQGPSPWGVTVKAELDKAQAIESQAHLYRRLQHHVGFLLRPVANTSVKAVVT